MEAYEEAGRAWSERMRTELELWTELGKNLTSTHSVPEAVQIYQQSLTRRMQMAAEDGQKFAADCQKLAQKIARTMSPGVERRKLVSSSRMSSIAFLQAPRAEPKQWSKRGGE